MDISVEKKSDKNYKKYIIYSGLGILSLFLGKYLWSMGSADFAVNRDTVVIGDVKRGPFTVSVRGSGTLVADQVMWVSTRTEAKVETRLVKAGDMVKKGDLIATLSNHQLMRELEEAKWELEALIEEESAAKIQQETTLLEQEGLILNNKLDYEKSIDVYEAHSQLVESGAVSRLDFRSRRVEMDQAQQRWLLSQKQLAKLKENMVAQRKSQEAKTKQAQNRFHRIKQQVDDLNIYASMDAVVLEVPIEPGQQLAMGGNIAKLAQHDQLIAELLIPEIQIRNVALGQTAEIDTRNNKISGIVSRIDPTVINGNVKVEIEFATVLPDDARPDLSVDGEIKIAELEDALFIERPLFAQTNSTGTLYKLDSDNELVERVHVQFGNGSMSFIQIESGLRQGERVITSDPSRFEGYETFRLN